MRVLQLAPLYQPIRGDTEYGSVERLVLLLDQGISAAGHRVGRCGPVTGASITRIGGVA